jgi:hypothetical protein
MNGTRAFVSAIRGPITVITLGVLFALNNFTPYRFDQTWPVLLIVFGLLTLLRRGVEPPAPPPPPFAYAPPAPPPTPYGQTPYSQTPYSQNAPPSGVAKGGFGGSAPQRPAEPNENPPANPGGTA